MSKKFELIDLFCGAGGMTLGFVDERYCGGFRSVFAIDNDEAAIGTYKANFGSHCESTDIERWLRKKQIPKADVVIGGVPCQGFSLLNRNRIGDTRRKLWEPFMDIVHTSGAAVFVMENVPGLLKSAEFREIEDYSENIGFKLLSPSILNTADYAVPQIRRRAIVVGIKCESFEKKPPPFPPAKTHQHPDKNDDLPNWIEVQEVIRDLPPPIGTEIGPDDDFPLNLHFGRKPTPVSLERYRAVPEGGNRIDLEKKRPDITPQCWIRKKDGGTDLFGRLWWDRPSVTIRTEFFKPEKGRYLHPSQDRPITHREAARFMSFPDDFIFKGSKINVAKQIGNAVPPVFAGQLAKYVKSLLSERKINAKRTP